MRNDKKVYKCEGLVIDLKDRERVILCQTDYEVFIPITIGTDNLFGGIVANRWSNSHHGKTITRKQVSDLLGQGFAIRAIRQPKKLKLVCS